MRLQPNGDTLHCFVSGDEFYHRLHDGNGFTILQDKNTGWYVYADIRNGRAADDWTLVPTSLIAGQSNPAEYGIRPNLIASPLTIDSLHKLWEIPSHYVPKSTSSSAKRAANLNRGIINHIVIFIRFSDDTEISTSYSTIESMFNDSSANSVSLHNYFWRASYGQLRIPTYFYPTPVNNTIVSYQDSLPRCRYMPYNAQTNPTGYQSDAERANLEFSLLERAVNYVNQNSPIPTDINLDYNNDGLVDNICFIVKGTYTGWNDLLWPHKWGIYDRYVYINNKRVYTFNLQLEGSGTHYFSTSTFCHEMFHTLGAPDLYHYYNYTDVTSVGSWDLMCSNTTPPQHMGMYMKMMYGNWIDSVPEIKEAGTYSLHSVGDSVRHYNQCYRINAGNPSQWYFLEYRDNNELFETTLPGSGLLIYRIDRRFGGDASFDANTVFDEVYIFRPNGNNDTTSGNIAQAFFSANAGRTSFTPSTNPHPWLTQNEIDTTIHITNIGYAGDSITFTYTPHRPQAPLCDTSTCTISVTMRDSDHDTWNGSYLSFENQNGDILATTTLGDCRAYETVQLELCDEPIVVKWNSSGVSTNECSYTILLGDNTVWRNTTSAANSTVIGTIFSPCGGSMPEYNITVQSCDNINDVLGSGTFTIGTSTHIRAYPSEHYSFIGWHDGPYNGEGINAIIHNTDDNRTITVTSDSLFTAIFAPEIVNIRCLVANECANMGEVEGGGDFSYGDTITIVAIPNSGFLFDYWRKNYNTTHITDNPLTVVVENNDTYRAFFKSSDGINTTSGGITIYSANGNIVINGAENQTVEIFDLLGKTIISSIITSNSEHFTMPHNGLYVVRLGGYQTQKIFVKLP